MSSYSSAQRKLTPPASEFALAQGHLKLSEMDNELNGRDYSSQSYQSTTPYRRSKESHPHLVPLRRKAAVKPARVAMLVRSTLVGLSLCLMGHLAVGACQQVAQGVYLAAQAPTWQAYQQNVTHQQHWYQHQLKQLASPISLEKRAREQMDYAAKGETLVAVQTY